MTPTNRINVKIPFRKYNCFENRSVFTAQCTAYKMIKWPDGMSAKLAVEMCVLFVMGDGYSPHKALRGKCLPLMGIIHAFRVPLNGIYGENIIFTCWNLHSVTQTIPTLQCFRWVAIGMRDEVRVAHFIPHTDNSTPTYDTDCECLAIWTSLIQWTPDSDRNLRGYCFSAMDILYSANASLYWISSTSIKL